MTEATGTTKDFITEIIHYLAPARLAALRDTACKNGLDLDDVVLLAAERASNDLHRSPRYIADWINDG
jgi:hypothetical protein